MFGNRFVDIGVTKTKKMGCIFDKPKNKLLLLLMTILLLPTASWAQNNKEGLHLKNALVIAQQDDLSDRYSIEGDIVRLFAQYHIHAIPSLNIVKQGGSPDILMSDSIQKVLKQKGIDTYVLVSIRGYDKRFKLSDKNSPFKEAIKQHNLYTLYRDGITHVTFSFKFYRNLKLVHKELIRTGTVGSETDVMKKLSKAVKKRLESDWL